MEEIFHGFVWYERFQVYEGVTFVYCTSSYPSDMVAGSVRHCAPLATIPKLKELLLGEGIRFYRGSIVFLVDFHRERPVVDGNCGEASVGATVIVAVGF